MLSICEFGGLSKRMVNHQTGYRWCLVRLPINDYLYRTRPNRLLIKCMSFETKLNRQNSIVERRLAAVSLIAAVSCLISSLLIFIAALDLFKIFYPIRQLIEFVNFLITLFIARKIFCTN